ncbi:WXG100 family type VII secretion target [Nocardia sp. NBC_01499]|uniref:WXG100 family type VII secretion target n=1 Tax=Nocardia sp. NBC_01499 TaxID=2903597 RepID=UPI0038639787
MRKLPHTPGRTRQRRNDPPYAPTVEVFDNMNHQEIHDKVQLLQPAVLTGGQQAWGDAAAGLADAVSQAHIEIRAAIADGWRGSAAQRAADVVQAFEQTGQDLADVLAVVSQRLGQAGDAAEALRTAVSAPSGKTPDLGAALLDPTQATSNVADQKSTEHTRQDIVRTMNDVYTGVFIPTGTDVPAFLDEQFGDAPTTPDGTPVSKVAGPGPDAGTPVAQAVPPQTLSTAAQPVDAPAADAPAADTPAEEQVADKQHDETAPATVAAASGVADASAGSPSAPPPSRVTTAAVDSPLSLATAAAQPQHTAPASTAATAPSTTTAAAAQQIVPTTPGTASAAAPEEPRKRDDRRKDSGGDAATGLGAGAMGGLMGGAMAVGDTPRQGSSVAANAATARAPRFEDDEDEDDFHFDDMPTYLEPADDNGELIGAIDPTTPPVLGEWTELE